MLVQNVNDNLSPSHVYDANEVVITSQLLQGDVLASSVHISTTLLLIAHYKLNPGEKYHLWLQGSNAAGVRNISQRISIGKICKLHVVWIPVKVYCVIVFMYSCLITPQSCI